MEKDTKRCIQEISVEKNGNQEKENMRKSSTNWSLQYQLGSKQANLIALHTIKKSV